MKLYDIIEAANSMLKEGTLVLHRNMKVHPTFKIYKIFCYDLYKIDNGNKELLLTEEIIENTSSEDITKIWYKCDKEYLKSLIKWLSSDNYKTMKKDGV